MITLVAAVLRPRFESLRFNSERGVILFLVRNKYFSFPPISRRRFNNWKTEIERTRDDF